MIGLSTITQNASGDLIIIENPDTGKYRNTSRVTRNKTLDGGVVLVYSGVTDGDRTLSIVADLTETEEAKLKDIFEDETLIYIATKNGCFSGAISRLNIEYGKTDFDILLKEKVSA